MTLKLSKPIAFFDLETTGISVTNDRIIEIAIIKVNPDSSEETYEKRVNPTIPIPESSTEIHGISDADVADAPTFAQIGREIAQFIKGCDLGGYNLIKFDVPLLYEEFLRAEIDFSLDNRKIVDAQKIFYLMEPRTLSAAYKFYCDKKLVGAHGAMADTLATYEVLKAQIDKYEGVAIEDKDGNEVTPIVNNMEKLHNLHANQFADLVGRIAFNNKGEEVFNFGKYKNQTVLSVLKKDPNYYDWMMRGDFALTTKKKLTEIRLRLLKPGT